MVYIDDSLSRVPKLPGDVLILGEDEEVIIPIGGIDCLRDEGLPKTAYDEKVPRWEEETPAWWDV